IVNNLDRRHAFLGYYREEEEEAIAAFMGCHLPEGGALCVDSVRPRCFTEDDQMLLHRFARHIARQTHSAGLANDAEEMRHYFDRLEELSELGARHPQWREYLANFLELLSQSTGFDYVTFASSAEGSPSYTVEGENTPLLIDETTPMPELPLNGGGLISWVFRNEVPVHAEGTDGSPSTPLFGKLPQVPTFQSVMCLPVQMNKVTCGVLCLAGLNPRPLPPNLRAFARMAVAHLAQHLELLFLRHRLKTLLPRAKVHRDGALAYDPDTAPAAPLNEED
ncbi:MAG: GAF domain-containing protein, partial [Bilophila sp.]